MDNHIHVLLVEDDENKRSRITQFYESAFPQDKLRHATSLVSGLQAAREHCPDLVLLDMTLPNYPDDKSTGFNPMRPFGGREFVRQVVRLNLSAKVVVVTQFETFGSPPDMVDLESLDREMRLLFPINYLGAVYYHASRSSWQTEITNVRNSLGVNKN